MNAGNNASGARSRKGFQRRMRETTRSIASTCLKREMQTSTDSSVPTHVDPAAFAGHYVAVELPLLQEQGARTWKLFVTEPTLNTFDRLPVRTERG